MRMTLIIIALRHGKSHKHPALAKKVALDTKILLHAEKFRCQEKLSLVKSTQTTSPRSLVKTQKLENPPSRKHSVPDFMPVPSMEYAGWSKAFHLHYSPPNHSRRWDCKVHSQKCTKRNKYSQKHGYKYTLIDQWHCLCQMEEQEFLSAT